MTTPVACGAESTIIHTVVHRPIIGALICAVLAVGGYSMTGDADSFGGCGEVGGDLFQVVQQPANQNLVCGVPMVPPVTKNQ